MVLLRHLVSIFVITCYSLLANADELREIQATKQGRYPIQTTHLDATGEPKYVNQLIREDSLYLLQHAHNPVNWRAWNKQSLAEAQNQGKPIFLSIGYSTCHWCHVMQRESFENETIAEFLNTFFIPIKVDREERPELDEFYLTSVQILSGKAGWPLTAVLTPQTQVFFGATYLTPAQLGNSLSKVADAWHNNHAAVQDQAQRVAASIAELNPNRRHSVAVSEAVFASADRTIEKTFLREIDAPSNDPGFPREVEMRYLLKRALLNSDQQLLEIVRTRLERILASGLYDQLGGGLHRYAISEALNIPHFEKMLYNQAQLIELSALVAAYTESELAQTALNQTIDFLIQSMRNPSGLYGSAIDAESQQAVAVTDQPSPSQQPLTAQKSEGAYYTWRWEELASSLDNAQFKAFSNTYQVRKQGNFQGLNVLRKSDIHRAVPLNKKEQKALNAALNKLVQHRLKRPSPKVDIKPITAWNALLASAYLTVYNTGLSPIALSQAEQIITPLLSDFKQQNSVARIVASDTRTRVDGALDDYAAFGIALVDLDLAAKTIQTVDSPNIKEQSWQQQERLNTATQVAEQILNRFRREGVDGFTLADQTLNNATHDNDKQSLLINARDDAITSANSLSAQFFAKLYRATGDLRHKQVAQSLLDTFSVRLTKAPDAMSGMLVAKMLLDHGDVMPIQSFANSKAYLHTQVSKQNIQLTFTLDDNWHINADKVLNEYLIPTKIEMLNSSSCSEPDIVYPSAKTVQLGFQSEPLSVFDGHFDIQLSWPKGAKNCTWFAADLSVQACSNEVCLQPERIAVRAKVPNR